MQLLDAYIMARLQDERAQQIAAAYSEDETAVLAMADYLQESGVDIMGLPEFEVGQKLFIRTITMYYIGEIIQVTPGFLRLGKASWVSQTEGYGDTISEGWNHIRDYCNYPDAVVVSTWSIVDATPWRHSLQPKKR